MFRPTLALDRIDAGIQGKLSSDYSETVQEVRDAVATEAVVVIGMEYNPHVARARKALTRADIPFTYLCYGGYTKEWRRRTAIKMWSGWHTFPHVFVNGVLIGGADEVIAKIQSGELQKAIAG